MNGSLAVDQKIRWLDADRVGSKPGHEPASEIIGFCSIKFSFSLHFSILLHPVRCDNQVLALVVIVSVKIIFILRLLTHNEAAVVSVHLVVPTVAVVKLRSGFGRFESVAECGGVVDWALRDERNSVHVRRFSVVEAVPVNRCTCPSHRVRHVDDNEIVLADVDGRSGNFSIYAHNAPFDTIGGDALLVEAIVNVAVLLTTAPTSPLECVARRVRTVVRGEKCVFDLRAKDVIMLQMPIEIANSWRCFVAISEACIARKALQVNSQVRAVQLGTNCGSCQRD